MSWQVALQDYETAAGERWTSVGLEAVHCCVETLQIAPDVGESPSRVTARNLHARQAVRGDAQSSLVNVQRSIHHAVDSVQ